jgi:hypothetical protein
MQYTNWQGIADAMRHSEISKIKAALELPEVQALIEALRRYANPDHWGVEHVPGYYDTADEIDVATYYGHDDDTDPWKIAADAIAPFEADK